MIKNYVFGTIVAEELAMKLFEIYLSIYRSTYFNFLEKIHTYLSKIN